MQIHDDPIVEIVTVIKGINQNNNEAERAHKYAHAKMCTIVSYILQGFKYTCSKKINQK